MPHQEEEVGGGLDPKVGPLLSRDDKNVIVGCEVNEN